MLVSDKKQSHSPCQTSQWRRVYTRRLKSDKSKSAFLFLQSVHMQFSNYFPNFGVIRKLETKDPELRGLFIGKGLFLSYHHDQTEIKPGTYLPTYQIRWHLNGKRQNWRRIIWWATEAQIKGKELLFFSGLFR